MTRPTLRRLVAVAALATLAGVAQAQTVLTFSAGFPPNHPMRTDVLDPWAGLVAEATGGEVRIEFSNVAWLGFRAFNALEFGHADIALARYGDFNDRFVHHGVIELPFMNPSSEAASVAFWQARERYFADLSAYGPVRVVATFVETAGTLMVAQDWRLSPPEFRESVFAADTPVAERTVAALGARPFDVTGLGQLVDAVEHGHADGATLNAFALRSGFPSDVFKAYLDVPGGLYTQAYFVMMSAEAHARIPESARPAFDSLTGMVLSAMTGRAYDASAAQGYEQMRQAGTTIVEPDAASMDSLQSLLAPLAEEWVDRMDETGVDARAAMALIRAVTRAHVR